MKEGITISILGVLVVFLGLFLIYLIISFVAYFFTRSKVSKNTSIPKTKITDETLTAIGLALYFNDLINKNWQEEITIQKLTPPVSTWVVAGRGTTMGKFIWSYRRRWK